MNDGDSVPGKPHDDRMRGGLPSSDDPIGEIVMLAEDPDSNDEEILQMLESLAATLSADEVFSVLVRYDTPDVLG
ncbi:MAG TPA: hypothetical protein VFM55_24965 [Micromonosporaceae bacterium]|nr:hypothetical protein [Micromonosporaceae bacterium]